MATAAAAGRQRCRRRDWSSARRLAALLLVAALAVAAAAATPLPEGPQPLAATASAVATPAAAANSTAAPADKYPMIVVFRDAATLAKLRLMCGKSAVIFRLFARALALPPDCYMPGACRRIYSQTISGESVGKAGRDGRVCRQPRLRLLYPRTALLCQVPAVLPLHWRPLNPPALPPYCRPHYCQASAATSATPTWRACTAACPPPSFTRSLMGRWGGGCFGAAAVRWPAGTRRAAAESTAAGWACQLAA